MIHQGGSVRALEILAVGRDVGILGKCGLNPLHLQSLGRPRAQRIRPVANFSPGSGPDGSGPANRADFQAKP